MTFKLRPYQQAAVDAAINHMSTTLSSWVIEAATGAGKSLIVAEIAKWIQERSGKKVLCLAPSKELVQQNHEKYLAYGYPASIWSAAVGQKCLRHNVVFGTPKSVHNSLEKFGSQFAAVICDEAHTTSPTIKAIINHMRSENPNLRVGGLTATPYRMRTGYIYAVDMENMTLDESQAINPFYDKLIYQIKAAELISLSYLTRPTTDAVISEHYDTSGLILKPNGKFDQAKVEQAFEGQGRKTAAIVSEVVAASQYRMGVMFFAATIQHAKEIMDSLPQERSCIVTGETPKKEREEILRRFKLRELKYLVNVSVLTTGFDAPHVDVVAILRKTESASLFQQIVGRGLRLHEQKEDCLVMDYAENIEFHELEDNLFEPKIKTSVCGGELGVVDAKCDVCGFVNKFTARKNPDGFDIDEQGYFVDLAGNRIEVTEGVFMPAHYGRRCNHNTIGMNYQLIRCEHRWSLKICPECDTENDIAARYCTSCRAELVDPNESLRLEFKRMKTDPRQLSTDRVIAWRFQDWISQKGNRSLRVDYTTEYRTFSVWYSPDSNNVKAQRLWADLCDACGLKNVTIDEFILSGPLMPYTVTSVKVGDFFKVTAHNLPEDIEP